MDTGRTFCHSVILPAAKQLESTDDKQAVPENKINKAIAVRGAVESEPHLLFDTEQLNFVALWTNDFVEIPATRFGLLRIPRVANQPQWRCDDARWQIVSPEGAAIPANKENSRFTGYRHVKSGVAFTYQLAGAEVRELARTQQSNTGCMLHRTISLQANSRRFRLPLTDVEESLDVPVLTDRPELMTMAVVERWQRRRIDVLSTTPLQIIDEKLYAVFPPTDSPACHQIILAIAKPGELPPVSEVHFSEVPELEASLIDDDTDRWGDPIVTRGKLAETVESAFVVDTLVMPLENRFNALMFTSGFDFLDDRRAYICTAHGDVWLVEGIDADLDQLAWKRFATGLYQPLGLKVVDGRPIVICRDRLTRLHDYNSDQEADFYENFNDHLVLFGQPHGYAMNLETDPQGNFYFTKSGSQPPHGGTMLKLTPDRKQLSVYATGFRHANGLGVSPTGVVTAADNEGNWVPATRIDLVRRGGFYGHLPTHRRPEPRSALLEFLDRFFAGSLTELGEIYKSLWMVNSRINRNMRLYRWFPRLLETLGDALVLQPRLSKGRRALAAGHIVAGRTFL